MGTVNQPARITVVASTAFTGTRRPMPDYLTAHIAGKGCQQCNLGILYAPVVDTSLPLYLRDAVLQNFGAIVWCECQMGTDRKAFAERVMMDVRTASTQGGIHGEYVAAYHIHDIEQQLAESPTVSMVEPEPEPPVVVAVQPAEEWWMK